MVDGLTEKYLFYKDNNKFRIKEKPVEFFDSIDLSDKNYFKYKNKKYQNILIHGIKGNGKTFAIEWFAEKFCEHHKCKAVYIVMPDFIEILYSLDFKEKRLYIENILKKYKLICIDEIHRFKINEHIYITIWNFLNKGNDGMNNFLYGSNLNKDLLCKKLGNDMMSRIDSNCLIIENSGGLLR